MFFAAYAAKAGFGVFIGRNGMNISRDAFPKGIYFEKCLSIHKVGFHEHQVNKLGNVLVSFDEEGLLFESEDSYLDGRISQRSIDLSKLIFLWGEEQGRVIKTRFNVRKKLMVTGGPRVDLWRSNFSRFYEPEISHLVRKHGRFIFIVCNWGYSQPLKDAGYDPDQIYDDIPTTYIRSAFMSLIQSLAESFPDKTIIIRPHPSDLKAYWADKAKGFPPTVKVTDEGSISPWLHAAQVIIHNNCTTGVEAWVGGIPVLAYSPNIKGLVEPNTYTMPVNCLGVTCSSEAEIVEKIHASYLGEPVEQARPHNDIIDQFLQIDDYQLASEKIISSLQALNIDLETYEVPHYGIFKKLRALIGSAKWLCRDLLGKSGMYTFLYTRHKNPGIQLDEIERLLSRLTNIVDVPNDFFEVRQVDQDTFCIFGKEDR